MIVSNSGGQAQLALSGSGEPNVVVDVLVNETAVVSTTIGESRQWSVVAPLADPDAYNVGIRATLLDGSVIAVPVALDAIVLAVPTFTPEPTATATAEPSETPSPTASPTPIPPVVNSFAVTPGETPLVVIRGRAVPNSVVAVDWGAGVAYSTTVTTEGSWTMTVTLPGAGAYAIALSATTAEGVVAAAQEPLRVEVGAVPDAPPPLSKPRHRQRRRRQKLPQRRLHRSRCQLQQPQKPLRRRLRHRRLLPKRPRRCQLQQRRQLWRRP
jgi:hypothetical protein